MQCIWCGNDSRGKESIEHIVPEAIGCPTGFVLKNGEVCRNCNNGFGIVDQALVADFEMFTTFAGVPRKGGRGPGVFSYGNIRAETKNSHTNYFVNMDQQPVNLSTGRVLGGYKGRERDVAAKIERDGDHVKVNWQIEFGRSVKVRRALFKIAVSWIAYSFGARKAREIIETSIGAFIKKGHPDMPLILTSPEADPKAYRHEFKSPWISESQKYVCAFRLGHMYFIIDLDENHAGLSAIYNEMLASLGPNAFTTLPPGWTPPIR